MGTFNLVSTHNYANDISPTSEFDAFTGDPLMRKLTEEEINAYSYGGGELPADNQDE